ncbi:MarR family transcriptional regulator [Corynebacterium qintianiae]
MPGPLGQPDFVALAGGVEWLARRRASGVAPQLAQADCAVLAALYENRALSPESLARRLGWTDSALTPVLRRLERSGALNVTPGRAYKLTQGMTPIGTLFALEAKVKDWKRGIFQGRAYRSWADNYVLLLGQVGPVAEQRANVSVAHDGAGLFNARGWLVRPKRRRSSPASRMWGFEHLFAAIAISAPSLG